MSSLQQPGIQGPTPSAANVGVAQKPNQLHPMYQAIVRGANAVGRGIHGLTSAIETKPPAGYHFPRPGVASPPAIPNVPVGVGSMAPVAPAPSLKPVSATSVPVAGSADALNAEYTKQGFGPGTTEAQVDAARGQHAAAINYSGQAQPGVHGPAPVSAAVTPGIQTQAIAAPVAAPASSDPVRAGLLHAYSTHARQAQSLGYAPNTFDGQTGMSGADHAAAMSQYAGQLAQYDAAKAQGVNNDPMRGIAAMAEGLKNPAIRSLQAAQAGVPAEAIPDPNAPPHADDSLMGFLNDGKMGIDAKLQGLGQFPGVSDPSHPNHAGVQNWFNRAYADPAAFNADFHEGDYAPGPNGQDTFTNPWTRMSRAFFGSGSQEAVGRNNLLRSYGINPAQAIRQQYGIKPSDY